MSVSGLTPDLAGFVEAQGRLRTELGRDIRFYRHADMIYDPALPASEFDDEGIPLDPLAGASAVASAGVAIPDLTLIGQARGNVVFQPLAAMRRDEVQEQPVGMRSRLNKDLILDIADMPLASGATYFEVGASGVNGWTADDGELWKIVNAKTDGFGGLQRYIVFGQGTE